MHDTWPDNLDALRAFAAARCSTGMPTAAADVDVNVKTPKARTAPAPPISVAAPTAAADVDVIVKGGAAQAGASVLEPPVEVPASIPILADASTPRV